LRPVDASRLVAWFRDVRRPLPWREGRDPYAAWVSETMLQQTTVEVVRKRYPGFLGRFPDLEALARADQEDVEAEWAGLGYYRRARALHAGVRAVLAHHDGRVPDSEDALLALPGVGPYTAAAILAFGFDRPVVAVDGNVARVAARLRALEDPLDSPQARAALGRELAGAAPSGVGGAFAEALIELGALLCRPVRPRCGECPLQHSCAGRRTGDPEHFPRRRPRARVVRVESHRALVRRGRQVLLVRRDATERLLPGRLEFPGRWCGPSTPADEALGPALAAIGAGSARIRGEVARARHAITRYRITSILSEVEGRVAVPRAPAAWHHLDRDPATALTTETRKLLRAGALL
jgi:A/G-specific adenine glycosylase